jgi:hypothetical protein
MGKSERKVIRQECERYAVRLAALYFNEPSAGRVFERDIEVWRGTAIQVAQRDERMMQTDSEINIGLTLCKLLC